MLVAGTQRNFLASLTRFGYPKENNNFVPKYDKSTRFGDPKENNDFVPKYDLSTNILAAD